MSSTDSLHAIPSLPFPNLANSTLSIIRIYTGSISDRSRYTDKLAPVPPSPFHLDLPGNLFKLTLACSLNLRSFQLHFSSSSSHSFHERDYVIQLWRMRMLGSYHWIKKRVIQYQQKRELLSLQSTMAMAVSNNLALPLRPYSYAPSFQFVLIPTGSTVAKFAGDTVHHRLAANQHFQKKDWNAALKRAFLETDEDLRASTSPSLKPSKSK